MARRTASDFIAEIRTAAGGPDTTRIPDLRILRILNEERAQTLSRYTVAQLISSTTVTSVASQAAYTLTPTNIAKVLIVKDNLGQELKETDQIDEVRKGTITSGPPDSWYCTSATQVSFSPTPATSGDVYTVYYQADPTDLVLLPTPTSETLPRVWDEVWLNKAIGKVLLVLGESSAAAPWIQIGAQAEQLAAQTLRLSDQDSRFQTQLEHKMSLGNRY